MNNYPYNLFECEVGKYGHNMIITEKQTQDRKEFFKTINGEWLIDIKHSWKFIDESNVEILDFLSIMYENNSGNYFRNLK